MKTSFTLRIFQTWEFRVSHGQLLIRSPKTSDWPTNIDLIFAGVEYMDLPRFLRGVEVDEPNEADAAIMRERLDRQGTSDRIFVIKSNNRRYYVVAAALQISENEVDIFDSPFAQE
jgi:hypothetical protein